MTTTTLTDRLIDDLVKVHRFKSADKCRTHFRSFFGRVPIAGRDVLDIGCGKGWMSLYAASEGARSVVSLEPEIEGSTSGDLQRLRETAARIGLGQIAPLAVTIQQFEPEGRQFDLVLMRASINHLDEEACIQLKRSREAVERYERIFGRIHELMRPGGTIIITDSSRYNLYGTFGFHGPLTPRIEWHKHQSPRVWISILKRVGFESPRLTWKQPSPLKRFGILTDNEVAAFLLTSRFRLVMERP